MSRRALRGVLAGLKARAVALAESAGEKADLSRLTDADLAEYCRIAAKLEADLPLTATENKNLAAFQEGNPSRFPHVGGAVTPQPLAVIRQALRVTDPLAIMDQAAWLEAILAPTPQTYYGLRDEYLDASAFLVHLFNVGPYQSQLTAWNPREEDRDRLATELAQRPCWLQENAVELRHWLLFAEFKGSKEERDVTPRTPGHRLRQMIQRADDAQAPERLSWWVESLTNGERLTPEAARTWLEAHATALEMSPNQEAWASLYLPAPKNTKKRPA